MHNKIALFLNRVARHLKVGKTRAPPSKPLFVMEKCSTVKEGKAKVFYPESVFYNPVQEFNRDLTIAVISQVAYEKHLRSKNKGKKELSSSKAAENKDLEITDKSESTKNDDNCQSETVVGGTKREEQDELIAGKSYDNGLRILEGLAASGLRSVRFGLEIPGVKEVIANDFDFNAVEVIKKNIELNNLQGLVTASCGDAGMVMYQNRYNVNDCKRFDVIDLDPYGSPHIFLDAAVQAVGDGGLLCITCTDAAVLCGNSGETCYSKYGSMSLRTPYCHEMGLRIILQSIESHANRYSRYTEPLLSVSVDFYFRVFVRVYTGQNKVKRSVSKMSMIYHCSGCGTFNQQRLGEVIPTKGNNFKYTPSSGPPVTSKCEHCGSNHKLGGPIWAEPTCNPEFVKSVIDRVQQNKEMFHTGDRIIGMLSLINEELQDVPLHYVMDDLFNSIHCTPMSFLKFRSAVLNAGYRVSLSHANKNSIKTDAPPQVIWDILRTWVKDNPVKSKRLVEGNPAHTILKKEPATAISFETHPDANPPSRLQKLTRFQHNPEKHWGPKAKAKRVFPADNTS